MGALPPWGPLRLTAAETGGIPAGAVWRYGGGNGARRSLALPPPRLNVCATFVQGLCKVCSTFVQGLFKVCSTFVQGLFNVCLMSIGSVTQLRPSLPQRSPWERARRRKLSGRAAGAHRTHGRGPRDEAAPARCPRAACPTVSPTAPPTVASALPLRQGAARSLLVVEPILREVAPRATICCLRSKPV
jgi:hypothetical protein